MFCCKCFYPLNGLSKCYCPECGRWFEPQHSRTFLPEPRRRWNLSRPSRKTLLVFGLLGLACVIALTIKVSEPQPAAIKLVPFNPFLHPGYLSYRTVRPKMRRSSTGCWGPYSRPYASASAELNKQLIASMPKTSVDSGDLQATPASAPWSISLTQPEPAESQ